MKIKHIERQAKMFPSLIGLPGEKSSEQEIEGAWAMNEDDSKQTAIILNPIEERDKTIFEQNQLIESLKEVQSKADSLKIELEKTQFDNSIMQKKLIFTRKATEERIFENISSKESYREDPLLVAVLSATLNEDEIDIEEEESQPSLTGEHLSRKDLFILSSLESKIDKTDDIQQERLSHLKEQVLEKIKTTKIRRSSQRSSSGFKRRLSFLGTEDPTRSSSRPRTASPPACSSDGVEQYQHPYFSLHEHPWSNWPR